MASRGGARASGTDGGDYMHRERVASHYTTSALNKGRIKWTVVMHASLFVLGLARLSKEIFSLAGVQVPAELERLNLPTPLPWELAWLPSMIASLFASLSLRKNNSALLWQALLGQLVLGLGPVCYGLQSQFPAFQKYLYESTNRPAGFPYVIVLYAWLLVALQVHLFQIYFAKQLLGAWRSATVRKVQ